MKIILTKGAIINGKKYPIGQKMDVTPQKFAEIDGAKPYFGQMMTKEKVKTDFFKPKKK